MVEGPVDLIWASPPCTHYSIARTTAKTPRDLEGSDALVRKVLNLADPFFAPTSWENPQSGLLKSRPVVSGIPFRIVDYCMHHDDRFSHQARKRTAIWTDTDWFPERPLCRKNCGGCVGGRHTDLAQRGPSRTNPTSRHTLEELYAIPPLLVEDILRWTQRWWPALGWGGKGSGGI